MFFFYRDFFLSRNLQLKFYFLRFSLSVVWWWWQWNTFPCKMQLYSSSRGNLKIFHSAKVAAIEKIAENFMLLLFCWGLGSPNRSIHVAVCADPFLRKLKMVSKGKFQGRMVFCNFWGNQVWSLDWGRNYFLKFSAGKCFHCTEQWKA